MIRYRESLSDLIERQEDDSVTPLLIILVFQLLDTCISVTMMKVSVLVVVLHYLSSSGHCQNYQDYQYQYHYPLPYPPNRWGLE